MECHEGAKMIKTFRGKLASDGFDTLVLHTNDGLTGYKVVKFDVFPASPDNSHETVIKIYSVASADVTTPTITVDFSDNELLGAAWYAFEGSGSGMATGYLTVVFDNMVFNQDIYVTNKCGQSRDMNYYIELEQIQLNHNEATVATLQSIRNA